MKKLYLLTILCFCLIINHAYCQNIYTVAGNGTLGYSGDGGPATFAKLNNPTGVCLDIYGNMYIADMGNNCIRKVNAVTHIITTYGGNGLAGYSGDGGPATSAKLSAPIAVAADGLGNIYIADYANNRIRKINTSGYISTVVGSISGFSGDGGLATAAQISGPSGIAVDAAGNLYISDVGNSRIRKVNTNGIISTIAGGGYSIFTDGVPATSIELCAQNTVSVDAAGTVYITNSGCGCFLKVTPAGLIYAVAGNGLPGYSGDGGIATLAQIESPSGICADISGNVYLCQQENPRVRKVDGQTDIITTIAGNGYPGYTGDNGPAINATVSFSIYGVYADFIGNIFLADEENNCIRMITSSLIQNFNGNSLAVSINKYCDGPQLIVATSYYDPALTAKIYFGDGTVSNANILVGYGGTPGYAIANHNYLNTGTYTIKTVLYDANTAVDSLSGTYEYLHCSTFPVKFYYDSNNNCIKDLAEYYINCNQLTEVDLNGTAIDTISSTSGFYYNTYSNIGDVYTFKVLTCSAGLSPSCPANGIVTDTVHADDYDTATKYIGFVCNGGNNFDLTETAIVPVTGINDQWGDIYVRNNYCSPSNTNAVVTLHFSPKYYYADDANPAPTSTTPTSITWNLNILSASDSLPIDLNYAI